MRNQIVSRGHHWIMVHGEGASVSGPWFKLDYCYQYLETIDGVLEVYFELNLMSWKPLSWSPGKPIMRNICKVNSDDFKQTQVGSKRYLDGMVGISPIVGRLSMLLFFSLLCSRNRLRMSKNVKQLWLDEGYTGDNTVSCVVQCMITVNLIWLSHTRRKVSWVALDKGNKT